jgi:ATP-binding cassette, subfamily B, bacterial
VNVNALVWQVVRNRPLLYLAVVVSMTIFFVGRLVPGLLELAFFNDLSLHSAAAPIRIIIFMVSFELARLVSSVAEAASEQTVRYYTAGALRYNILGRILSSPNLLLRGEAAGEDLSRFRDDVEDVVQYVTTPVVLVASVVFAVIAIWVMVSISVTLTVVVVFPLMVVVGVASMTSGRVQAYRLASRTATAAVTGFLGEVFQSAQSIKLMAAEQHVLGRLRELNKTRQQTSVKDAFFTQALNSIFYNSSDIAIGGVLVLAAAPMTSGTFTVGDLALFSYYLFFVARLPLTLGQVWVEHRQAAVAAARLSVIAAEPSQAALARSAPPLSPAPAMLAVPERLEELRVSGLSYRYPGGGRSISGVDFTVRHGSFTVVTGRVGSGKSTLLRVVLGLLPRDAGALYWNGEPIVDAAAFLVPPRCAYCPQAPGLSSDSLRDNILMGLPDDGVRLAAAIRDAALESDIAELESGLDTVVGPRGVKLSGGQAQRTALARMLVREAALYVVDDLGSSVDLATGDVLLTRMKARTDATYLVTSHRRSVLSRADQIIVLQNGIITGRGTLAELLAQNHEMQRLWQESASEENSIE